MVGIDVETVDGPKFTLEVNWNHAPFCDSVMEQNVGRFDNRVRAEEASMDIQWPPGIYKSRPHKKIASTPGCVLFFWESSNDAPAVSVRRTVMY